MFLLTSLVSMENEAWLIDLSLEEFDPLFAKKSAADAEVLAVVETAEAQTEAVVQTAEVGVQTDAEIDVPAEVVVEPIPVTVPQPVIRGAARSGVDRVFTVCDTSVRRAFNMAVYGIMACVGILVACFWITRFIFVHWISVITLIGLMVVFRDSFVPVLRWFFGLILWSIYWLFGVVLFSNPFEIPAPEVVIVERSQPWLVASVAGLACVLLLWMWFSYPRRARFVDYTGFQAEKAVPGSTFLKNDTPSFVASVETKMEGSWYKAGVGFRTKHGFLTAGHVVAGAEKVRLVTKTGKVELDTVTFEPTDVGDCVVFKDVDKLASLGLAQANLSKVALGEKQREMVMVHNGELSSMGPLEASPNFGYVDYGGSTAKGFSGSPYYVNKTVFGMHLGAGVSNCGYEAAYIQTILEIRKEESEDYWLDKIKQGKGKMYKHSPHNPDEVMVKINGNYIMMDAHSYYAAQKEADERMSRAAEEAIDKMMSSRHEVFGSSGGGRIVWGKGKGGKRAGWHFQDESAVGPPAFPDAMFDDSQGNFRGPAANVLIAAGPEKGSEADVRKHNMPSTSQMGSETHQSSTRKESPTVTPGSIVAPSWEALASTYGLTPELAIQKFENFLSVSAKKKEKRSAKKQSSEQ